MPAKRLPWFKLWIGSTAHGKVRQLDDGTFRTWVELLDVAAQQPKRGRFDSTLEALAITRRPRRHLVALIDAGLLDERADGLWMHDWEEWQRWRPEDANDAPIPPDRPPNGLANNSRTTTEAPANGSAVRVRSAAPASGEERSEKGEEEEETPKAATQPKVPLVAFTESEQGIVDAVGVALSQFGFSLEPRMWRKVFDTYSAVDLEAEAYKQADWLRRNRVKSCSAARYTNWLGKAGANVTPIRRGATTDAALREHMAQEFGYLATKGSA